MRLTSVSPRSVSACPSAAAAGAHALGRAGVLLLAGAIATGCGGSAPDSDESPGLSFRQAPEQPVAREAIQPPVQVAVAGAAGAADAGGGRGDADASGRAPPEVSLSLVGGPDEAALSGSTTAPLEDGVATFEGLRVSRAGSGYALRAEAPGFEPAESSAFEVRQPDPDAETSELVAEPGEAIAGGAEAIELTVTARDAGGEALPGVEVGLSIADAEGTLEPASGTTGESGRMTATLTAPTPGPRTVTATLDDGAATLETEVSFVSGGPSSEASTLTADPASAVANGEEAVELVATVRDGAGNPVAGADVALTASGEGTTLEPSSGTTGEAGRVTATLTSTVAETKTVTASVGEAATMTTEVVFEAGAPSAETSELVVEPDTEVADGEAAITLAPRIRDAQGNPVPGVGVSLSASGEGHAITPSEGVTGSDGTFEAALTSTVAEPKTVTAAVGEELFTLQAEVVFEAGAPAASTSSLEASPSTATADGDEAVALTATVRDAQGNPVPEASVSLSASGTGNVLSSPEGTTGADGVFETTVTSTVAGSKTVTAAVGGGALSLDAEVVFEAGTPAASTSSLEASPSTATADGAEAVTLTATVRDAQGNPVPEAPVTLSASGEGNTLSPSEGATSAEGTFEAELTSTLAEAKTVMAAVDGGAFTLDAEVVFEAGAPAASTSSLEASPSTATADGAEAVTLTATVRDAQGNPVPETPVTLSASGEGNALSPTEGTTDAAGEVVATLTSTVAGSKTVTASVAEGTVAPTAEILFEPGVPVAETSSLDAEPSTVVADGEEAATLTATVRDAQGNPVPDVAVSLLGSGSADTLSPAEGKTDDEGVLEAELTSTLAEAKTLTAIVGNGAFTLETSLTFEPGAPAKQTSTLAAAPEAATADGEEAVTLTATVRDAQGNPVPEAELALSVTGDGASFTSASGTTSAEGTFEAELTSTVAEAKTVTASVAGGAPTLSREVVFEAGAPAEEPSTLVAAPEAATADGEAAVTLTATIRDAQGNPVPEAEVALSASGEANQLSPAAGSTGEDGELESALRSTVAEPKTVTASVAEDAFSLSREVVFEPGPAAVATSSLEAEPAKATADGEDPVALTARLRDAQGNPVPDVEVVVTASGAGHEVSTSGSTTNAEGVLEATLTSTVAGSKTVTATASGGAPALTTSVVFEPGAPSAEATTVAAEPSTATANGSEAVAITATVRDAEGNAVPGVEVALSASGAGNELDPGTGETNADGSFEATLTSTVAEAKTVTADVGDDAFAVQTEVAFVADAPTAEASTLQASPAVATADGEETVTLTATVLDAQGNPVPDFPVTWSATGTGNDLGPVFGMTDDAGVVEATLTSTAAGDKEVTAEVGGAFALDTGVTFEPGAPSAERSMLEASPSVATADGAETVTVTATVRDGQGNAVPEVPVELAASGSGNVLEPTSGSTSDGGVLEAELTSTVAEAKTLTAEVGDDGPTLEASTTFEPGAPAPKASELAATPETATADGEEAVELTATVRDAQGNPVPDVPIAVTASGSENDLDVGASTTSAKGVVEATLTSTTAETKTVTVSVAQGAFVLEAGVLFEAGAPVAETSTLEVSPSTATADGEDAVSVAALARDAEGNPVPGVDVSLSASGSGNELSPGAGSTGDDGRFTSSWTSTKAEAKTVEATVDDGAFTLGGDATFEPGAPDAATSTLVASPEVAVADGSSPIALTTTVRDAQGNPVPGVKVELSATGSDDTLVSSSGTTSGEGVFEGSLLSTKAEAKTVEASVADGAFALEREVVFEAGAPVASTSSLEVSPATATADGEDPVTVTATLRDAQGNRVPEAGVALSASGSGNALEPASGTTSDQGIFQATWTSTRAETKTVTAAVADGTFSLDGSATFEPGAPAATTSELVVVADPAVATANGEDAIALRTTVRDAQGNPVPEADVVLSVSGSDNELSPGSGSTDADGVLEATLSSTRAEAKTITAEIAGGEVAVETTATFEPGPPTVGASQLVASPTPATADGSDTILLTTSLRDAQGNPVPVASVDLSVTGSGNDLQPGSGETGEDGTFAATLTSTTAEDKLVTAEVNDGAFELQANVAFEAGAPTMEASSLVAEPATATADGSETITLTTTVRDAEDNPVPNATVELSVTGLGNEVDPSSGPTSDGGVFEATLTSLVAEDKTVTATVNGGAFALETGVTFEAGAPAAASSELVAEPATATADGSETVTLTTTVEDANGNPVPNAEVSLAASGSDNTFEPGSGATSADGTFVAELTSTLAQDETVTATVNGGALELEAGVTFEAGAPAEANSSLAPSPSTATADGTDTITLTTTVRDAQGNPVPDASVALVVTGSNNGLSPNSGDTNDDGTFLAVLSSTTAEDKTVEAEVDDGSVVLQTGVTFVAGPPEETTSSLVADPSTTTANGVDAITLTTTVLDAQGNPVPGAAVELSVSGSDNALEPSSGVTSDSGQLTAELTSTRAETKTVTASVSGGDVTLQTSVTFEPGSPSETTSSLVAAPDTATADGSDAVSLTTTVRDAQGNPIPGVDVTLSASGSAHEFTLADGTTGTQVAGQTDASGELNADLTSTNAEDETVLADVDGFGPSLDEPVTFVAGPPSATQSTVSASPNQLDADGESSSTITVTVVDEFGNPVPDRPVELATSGSASIMQPGPTGSDGVTTGSISSTQGGTQTVTATVDPDTDPTTIDDTASVTFQACTLSTGVLVDSTSPGSGELTAQRKCEYRIAVYGAGGGDGDGTSGGVGGVVRFDYTPSTEGTFHYYIGEGGGITTSDVLGGGGGGGNDPGGSQAGSGGGASAITVGDTLSGSAVLAVSGGGGGGPADPQSLNGEYGRGGGANGADGGLTSGGGGGNGTIDDSSVSGGTSGTTDCGDGRTGPGGDASVSPKSASDGASPYDKCGGDSGDGGAALPNYGIAGGAGGACYPANDCAGGGGGGYGGGGSGGFDASGGSGGGGGGGYINSSRGELSNEQTSLSNRSAGQDGRIVIEVIGP